MNNLPQAIPSDRDIESQRISRLILSAVTAPDARSAVVAHSDFLREGGYSVDQVMYLIRKMKKKASVTVGDRVTFVLEFVLPGKGTNLHITKAFVDEFYDHKPTDDHVKQLRRTIANALSNYHRFKLEPRVSMCLPVWRLDSTSRGCKSSDRTQRNRAIVESTRNLCPELIRELFTSQPYPKSVRLDRSPVHDISPVDVHNDMGQALFVTIDTPSPSQQIEADTYLPQSSLGTVHNAHMHTLAPTPVFSSPSTDTARTLSSSSYFTGTRSAEKGKLLQLPLLSPAMTLTTIAEPNATPAASPSIFSLFSETSPIPRLDQRYGAMISDFDRLVDSRPGSLSLPCTAPTLQQILEVPAPSLGLGMEIPLDELSGFDDPSFTMPDFYPPSPSFKDSEGSRFLNHPAVHEEVAVPSLQPDEWPYGSAGSSLVEGRQRLDRPTDLDPSQLLTFDQIMSLILGEPPIDPSSSETAERGNPPFTLPPYPGQSITPGNLREEMEAEADFAEYPKTWFLLD